MIRNLRNQITHIDVSICACQSCTCITVKPLKAQSKLQLTKSEFISVNSIHDQAA